MSVEDILIMHRSILATMETLKYMSYIIGAYATLAGFRVIKKIWKETINGNHTK